MNPLRLLLEYVTAAGAISASVYYLVALLAACRFKPARAGQPQLFPAVSILKPVRGLDPALYANLRGHCLQDYPEYEIVVGVADEDDPALPALRQLIAEFPARLRLVMCPCELGVNRKVSNLVQMLPQARHKFILVSDADIAVTPDYLREIMAGFAEANTGLVTCLYRAVAGKSLWSKLEALSISTDFAPGVLVAQLKEAALRFAMGSTMAVRREVLEQIGGLEPLLDYLADDYQLGLRVAAAGHKVALSHTVVETHLPDYLLREFWAHQMRWARGTRASRPGGYVGLVFTFGFFWAVCALLASGGAAWSWWLVALVAVLRSVTALYVGAGILRDRQVLANLWLLPFRDLVGVAVWLWSFGNGVSWRGRKFVLDKGRLRPLT